MRSGSSGCMACMAFTGEWACMAFTGEWAVMQLPSRRKRRRSPHLIAPVWKEAMMLDRILDLGRLVVPGEHQKRERVRHRRIFYLMCAIIRAVCRVYVINRILLLVLRRSILSFQSARTWRSRCARPRCPLPISKATHPSSSSPLYPQDADGKLDAKKFGHAMSTINQNQVVMAAARDYMKVSKITERARLSTLAHAFVHARRRWRPTRKRNVRPTCT